jgi:predicted RNA-binding Zn-ribbon protein involved in translation (DUF1610 family)
MLSTCAFTACPHSNGARYMRTRRSPGTSSKKRSTSDDGSAARGTSEAPQASSSTKASATGSPAATETQSFVCPECGRTFTRAAALGSHRSRVHGVQGSKSPAAGSVPAISRPQSERTRRTAAPKTTSNGSRRARSRRATPANTVDRDALLASLFPDGVPPREAVIREVAAWLDQAERLAKLR